MTEEELLERYPELRRVCPVEDCPHLKRPYDYDCGNHEDWMT